MNILFYGLGGTAVFIIFIAIYSHIEMHYSRRTYRLKLSERLKKEMDTDEEYRHKLALAIPIGHEIFPAKEIENMHHVNNSKHGIL